MKNQFSLLILTVFAIACSSKPANLSTDLELSNLKGLVWKIDKTNHSSQAGCVCPAAQKNECNQSLVIYNEKGNISESFDIDANGDTVIHSVYIYNRKGVCSGIEKFKGEMLTGREIPDFEKGKLAQVMEIDENGNKKATYIYKYKNNEVAEILTLNPEGDPIGKTINEYVGGKLVSQTESDKNGSISTTKYKRNERNDIVESVISVSKDSSDYKILFEYEYDELGNWIKQTKIYNGEIVNVVLRNIIYYEESI